MEEPFDWRFAVEFGLVVIAMLVGFVSGWLIGRSDRASGRG